MPVHHFDKPRAKTMRADHRSAIDDTENARSPSGGVSNARVAAQPDTIDKIDWLALWALSLAVSAMFIAALAYFGEGDATGAAAVLAGTAALTATSLFVTKAPGARA